MDRVSLDVRATQELRADNERLCAELASIGHLGRRRRMWRIVVAAAWLAVIGANALCGSRCAKASLAAQLLAARNAACRTEVDTHQEELPRKVLRLDGDLEVDALEDAVVKCLRRSRGLHGARCTKIVWEPGGPWPSVCTCR